MTDLVAVAALGDALVWAKTISKIFSDEGS